MRGRDRENPMPLYLIQYSFTHPAWEALVRGTVDGPTGPVPVERNRRQAVDELVREFGGKFPNLIFDDEDPPRRIASCKKFMLGEHDVMAIIEFPDNISAAAFSMAVSAGGSVTGMKTTPLLTMEEAIDAMGRAERARDRFLPPHKPRT
jgi:uncharacterized protein with GYD domain